MRGETAAVRYRGHPWPKDPSAAGARPYAAKREAFSEGSLKDEIDFAIARRRGKLLSACGGPRGATVIRSLGHPGGYKGACCVRDSGGAGHFLDDTEARCDTGSSQGFRGFLHRLLAFAARPGSQDDAATHLRPTRRDRQPAGAIRELADSQSIDSTHAR